MRYGPLPGRVLCLVASATLLAGCASTEIAPRNTLAGDAGTQAPATAQRANPNIVCHPNYKLLYVSQFNANVIDIYQNPQLLTPPGAPAATILPSQGLVNPAGMTVRNQVLYVANSGAGNLLGFKLCGSGPGAKFVDAPYIPVDVAVSSAGNLYASNSSPANVTVFVGMSPNYTPALTLTDPNANLGGGITIDSAGNCYWSFTDTGNVGHVDEFFGCVAPGITLGLTPAQGTPNAVRMENHSGPNDRLVFENGPNYKTYIYAQPYAAPAAPSPWGSVPASPLGIALNQPVNKLFVADVANGVVRRYKYPGGAVFGAPVSAGLSIAGGVTGVALSPPPP